MKMRDTKRCTGPCGQVKDLSEYTLAGGRRLNVCRDCRNDAQRDKRAQTRAAVVPESVEPSLVEEAVYDGLDRDVARLFEVIRRGAVSFERLCDKLDLAPTKVRRLIEKAADEGYDVHLEQEHVGRKPQDEERVFDTAITPVRGKRQMVGYLGDLHFGSKYCLREQIKDFVHYAYDRGCRTFLSAGDILEGCYRHAQFELSSVGIEDQTREAYETLPKLPGLSYHAIMGNHDNTFTDKIGVDVGKYISRYFVEHGRDDFHSYGDRGAFLKVGGILVHLWHPRSGMAYALSYPLQKQIERYQTIKPQITLVGHWHKHAIVYERGVYAIAAPCFQGGGSAFGKSLGGSPAIGGMILSWDVTEHGTIRGFVPETRFYFEREKPFDPFNDLDGDLV